MGRHRKQQTASFKRSSVLALTGLVPAGLAAVTAATNVSPAALAQHLPNPRDLLTNEPGDTLEPEVEAVDSAEVVGAQPVAAVAPTENLMAKAAPPPQVKSVALAGDRVAADLPAGTLGIPGIAMAAYQNAEDRLAAENPTCNMDWSMLAGIGRVESTHVYNGKADKDGNPLKPVYGPVLDGSLFGNNVIHDSDGGVLDNISGYDRAVGPMQFLPETWTKFAADGNNDGIADPQNFFDATLTAGKYLCHGGLDMRNTAQQTKAILRYNNSMAYVANVMAWANSYSSNVAPKPADLPRI
ncbi:lytic transglycosylase domain-containing protein [Nocardia sp. NPDC057353]|uniref:lytic transglycosylase domain-containing protein n=1 Tax=Nocardia sp. NPDC057353 TaxID=3346104 RepID=UPI00362A3124